MLGAVLNGMKGVHLTERVLLGLEPDTVAYFSFYLPT
jgi:hypothetical protein